MNILITSAGRQVFLVNAFKEALGKKGKVFTSDIDKDAPALKASDIGFISPAFTDRNYIKWLEGICRANDVNLLITLNVDDLLILERNRRTIENETECKLIGGPLESIQISNDKYEVVQLCRKLDLPVVKTWLTSEVNKDNFSNFPLMAKPRYGKGGRGNVIIQNKTDLNEITNKQSTPYVFQELIKGEEYGFDIINDFSGSYNSLLGRLKKRQKNGESYIAKTVNPMFWENSAKKLSRELKHQGTVNFDVLFKENKGYIIDINFRFSGDYVFSHVAGANTPMLYVNFYRKNISNKIYVPAEGVISRRMLNSAKIIKYNKL